MSYLCYLQEHFEIPILRGRKNGASRADCVLAEERLREFNPLRDKMVLRREKVSTHSLSTYFIEIEILGSAYQVLICLFRLVWYKSGFVWCRVVLA